MKVQAISKPDTHLKPNPHSYSDVPLHTFSYAYVWLLYNVISCVDMNAIQMKLKNSVINIVPDAGAWERWLRGEEH